MRCCTIMGWDSEGADLETVIDNELFDMARFPNQLASDRLVAMCCVFSFLGYACATLLIGC